MGKSTGVHIYILVDGIAMLAERLMLRTFRRCDQCSGAEFVRKEIHLQIVPGQSLVKLLSPLAPLVELQRILFQEEQAAFRHAIAQSTV